MSMWEKLKVRRKMVKVFKSGQLYLGDLERPIFPKIHGVVIGKTTTITFTLPNGLDPKLLKKNFYVFQQEFGKKAQLEGEIKKFTLIINDNSQKDILPYNFEQLKEIIQKENYSLPIICGQDRNKKLHIYDAKNNPNLLIFGQPGSGKSSILHVILSTLIQYFPPEELQLVLADFKMSEFCVYERVEHVRGVCYTTKDLKPQLAYLMNELTLRGQLLKKYRVRHMSKVPEDDRRPAIVFALDEFVMIRDREIMAEILQIASLGRAYAIYVILSMQRPSHKILDSDIRGVISVRMGFRTVDLRNALMGETPGSEKISKDSPGTFLLNLDELIELQAPYLNEDEVEKILEPYKSIRGRNAKETPSMHFEKELETTEIQENIFGVLDE
ncbi:FtsK/SpoIIIE domain-containing protein [Parafrankia elaeagni]|uniref:FtsK/SpoIIIE domain-containing protein n=1 Tax=Parafrankia elaeagni TaxID=222534 RepID=UPI0005516C53|nr:FtsK/SpoIIIE domain-containing protein [Parafrankia elaeagni]